MDPRRFDSLARALGADTSRRSLLRVAAGAALGGILGSRGRAADAADKAFVCHKGKTQEIAASALPAHLGHGDTQGPCCLQTTFCGPGQILTVSPTGACACGCPAGTTDCAGQCLDLATDPTSCGQCGAACAPANANGACVVGACVVGACLPGFGDCNGAPDDGCETGLLTDAANCGACGTVCTAPDGGQARCEGGLCVAGCDEGFTDCGGVCVDLVNDPIHCGSCVNACGAPTCSSATCVDSGCVYAPIDGCCDEDADCDDANPCTVDTCDQTTNTCVHDPADEGTACDDDTVCNGRETCDGAGTCQPGEALDCDDDDACTVDTCDPVDGCAHEPAEDGTECGDDRVCTGGGCECAEGLKTCADDGPCVSLASCCTDADCDAGDVCQDGACTCPIGLARCNGQCISEANCCVDADCGGGQYCGSDRQCAAQLGDQAICARNGECISGSCLIIMLNGPNGSVVLPGICGDIGMSSVTNGSAKRFFAADDPNYVVLSCEEYNEHAVAPGVVGADGELYDEAYGVTILNENADAEVIVSVNYVDNDGKSCQESRVNFTFTVQPKPTWLSWQQSGPNTIASIEEQQRWNGVLAAHELGHTLDAYRDAADFNATNGGIRTFTTCYGSPDANNAAHEQWRLDSLTRDEERFRDLVYGTAEKFDEADTSLDPDCTKFGPCLDDTDCRAADSCSDGRCCPTGSINCFEQCVDVQTDPAQCGFCAPDGVAACKPGEACEDGECTCGGSTCGACTECQESQCVRIPGCCDPPCGVCDVCEGNTCVDSGTCQCRPKESAHVDAGPLRAFVQSPPGCGQCEVCNASGSCDRETGNPDCCWVDSDCQASCQTCDTATHTCKPCPTNAPCCNGTCTPKCATGSVLNPTTCRCELGTCSGGTTSCRFNEPRTCGATKQCVCRSMIGGAGNGCFSPGFLSPQHVTPCTRTSCGPGYRCVSVAKSCAETETACAGLCAN